MSTFIIGLIVFAALSFSAYRIFKNSKNGSCGCDCGNCSGCGKTDD